VIAFPLDVSEGGARLLVEGPFEAGEEVVLGFEAPSHQRPLTQHGHVVWAFQVTVTVVKEIELLEERSLRYRRHACRAPRFEPRAAWFPVRQAQTLLKVVGASIEPDCDNARTIADYWLSLWL
jgi:hypothetical protein